MMRRIVVATAVLALGTSGLVASGISASGAAKPPPFNAAGSVTCSGGTGKGKVTPPFTLTAQAGTRETKSKFKPTCTGTTGNPAVTPISAKIEAISTSPAASTCVDLQVGGETFSTTVVTIKWKASGGKILPTTIIFSSILGGTPVNGTATVIGSYGGNDAVSTVLVSDSVATLTAACLKKGIKKLNFGGGGALNITP
jgi:hypothetical protein